MPEQNGQGDRDLNSGKLLVTANRISISLGSGKHMKPAYDP
jgi:hypothetical protein